MKDTLSEHVLDDQPLLRRLLKTPKSSRFFRSFAHPSGKHLNRLEQVWVDDLFQVRPSSNSLQKRKVEGRASSLVLGITSII